MADISSADLAAKETGLRTLMREMGSVLVAYSGGVDSSYLAVIANEELGEQALAVMGISPSVAEHQRAEARGLAAGFTLNYREIDTSEIDDPRYRANPENRCYFCKSELYGRLTVLARSLDIPYIIDGTNFDDLGGHRPGRVAADENGVRSPLAEVGLGKSEIRELSRAAGIAGWEKPASPCLSSRIAHGVPVTIERLSRVERGEAYLRSLGLREFRVRVHDGLARIEISPDEMGLILNPEAISILSAEFKKIGFDYVTFDLEGYRSGSLSSKFNNDLKIHNLENDH